MPLPPLRFGPPADEPGDVRHAQLAMGEDIQDADARGIAEHAERIGQGLDRPGLEQPAPAIVGGSWSGRYGSRNFGNHMNL